MFQMGNLLNFAEAKAYNYFVCYAIFLDNSENNFSKGGCYEKYQKTQKNDRLACDDAGHAVYLVPCNNGVGR